MGPAFKFTLVLTESVWKGYGGYFGKTPIFALAQLWEYCSVRPQLGNIIVYGRRGTVSLGQASLKLSEPVVGTGGA